VFDAAGLPCRGNCSVARVGSPLTAIMGRASNTNKII
jgi:hypothetical protein